MSPTHSIRLSLSGLRSVLLVTAISCCFGPAAIGADWPQWRGNAARSGASDQQLAPTLHLQWVLQLPALKPVWSDEKRMQFDRLYEPIVMGDKLMINSPLEDTVAAYDLETGKLQWRYVTDGPLRLPPAGHGDKVYCVSDDGYLYCLRVADGELLWKFRGGPSDRKILGNERVISTWPARGGAVVSDDGVVYFAASIWPFMGIFIHALDADTGEVVWTSDGDGSDYIKQPHDSDSFAGVAPQGAFCVSGDRLLVPSGRSVPACYDRHTGKQLYFHLAENKRYGGSDVMAGEKFFFNGSQAFELDSGGHLMGLSGNIVLNGDQLYNYSRFKQTYAIYDLANSPIEQEEKKDRFGRVTKELSWKPKLESTFEGPGGEALIKAGDRLYAAGVNQIVAFDLPMKESTPKPSWEASLAGTPEQLLAGGDRLFAVTATGEVFCFGPDQKEVVRHKRPEPEISHSAEAQQLAQRIVSATQPTEGYCICWGIESGDLVVSLARASQLHIVAVDPDEQRVDQLRQRLLAAGLYGHKVAVHVGTPETFEMAPYLASLVVSERPAEMLAASENLEKILNPVRPFGGTACWTLDDAAVKALQKRLGEHDSLAQFELHTDDAGLVRVVRQGALPGSGNWTHESADASNTRVSPDGLVRAPLGVLWFGGPSNRDVLPRHGHGPQPQVIDGRLIIEGANMLRAVDIYNGILLWQRDLPGIGYLYDNTSHQPGANSIGTNYISTRDGIYVAYQSKCLRLDLETGETIQEFTLPTDGDGKTPAWGYINVVGDYLIGGADPLTVEVDGNNRPKQGKNENSSASKRLVVMQRTTGEVLWSVEAKNHFRHHAICIGGDRLYCVDLLSQGERARLKRRGEQATTESALLALDLESGELLWSTDEGVFGTWLSYSDKHDVLVESGRPLRDSLLDEPKGMRAFQAADGTLLWAGDQAGPAMIHGDQILMQGSACHLLTGEPVTRVDPISGETVPWTWTRNYGCNSAIASKHLLTFRSGAAGYFDLANDGGTGNFGGFRSGCTNNLIVAGGILSAPDYTRSCTCSYQNQTSLALIHMPQAEMWTQFSLRSRSEINTLGLNLGAPGHRRDAKGRLWMNEHRNIKVEYVGDGLFNRYSARLQGEPLPWVSASGCHGIKQIEIDPNLSEEQTDPAHYTVRLYFCDPDNDQPGARLFNVSLQGEEVLHNFDIAREAGGRDQTVVKEFSGIPVSESLIISFEGQLKPDADPQSMPLLNGVELIRDP